MTDYPQNLLVLLLEGPGQPWEWLAERIEGLGFPTLRVETLEDGLRACEEEQISCALLPTEFADSRLKRALKVLRKRGGGRKILLGAVGPEPAREPRKWLRSAGVEYALWEPFDDETLRFQLNRMTLREAPAQVRQAERIPTSLSATMIAGGRERDAVVYSLSVSGAYLSTPRACMSGARVGVTIGLPSGRIEVPSVVIFSNVTGNLQKSNLPNGVGVCFEEIPEAETKALRNYVDTRRAQLFV